MSTDYVTPIVAVVGTIFGGVGLEVTRRLLSRAKDKDDSATQFRNELREELTTIKAELDKVEDELDAWKQKYYDLLQQYIDVKAQLEEALRKLPQK